MKLLYIFNLGRNGRNTINIPVLCLFQLLPLPFPCLGNYKKKCQRYTSHVLLFHLQAVIFNPQNIAFSIWLANLSPPYPYQIQPKYSNRWRLSKQCENKFTIKQWVPWDMLQPCHVCFENHLLTNIRFF